MPRDQSPYLPDTVRVCFISIWDDDYPQDTKAPVPYEVDVKLSDVLSAIPSLAGQAGVTNRKKLFHSTAVALFKTSSVAGLPPYKPTNDAALQALSKKIATDFYQWRSTAYDKTLSGVVAWAPDGACDITWTYLPCDAPGGKVYKTRAMAWPRNDEPEEFSHVDEMDPTLPAIFYHVKSSSSGIPAAGSATQMSGAAANFYKSDINGLLTVLNDAYGNPVTKKVWNKATSGAIPPNVHGGATKDSVGKWIWTLLPC